MRVRARVHVCVCECVRVRMHSCVRMNNNSVGWPSNTNTAHSTHHTAHSARTRARTRTRTHTHTHTNTQPHTPQTTDTHTHSRAHAHTHTRTHTHAHTATAREDSTKQKPVGRQTDVPGSGRRSRRTGGRRARPVALDAAEAEARAQAQEITGAARVILTVMALTRAVAVFTAAPSTHLHSGSGAMW